MQTKEAIKRRVFSALKRPAIEGAFARLFEQTAQSPRVHSSLVKFVPQPYSYDPADVREAERYGLRWRFRPYSYFQWHHYFGVRDDVLATLLVMADGAEVVFDVGANIGLYSISMARRAGRVLCFEPNPVSFAAVEEHIALNRVSNVSAFQCALGAKPGELELGDPSDGDLGKFSLRAQDDGGVMVPVRTVDEVVESEGLTRLDLMKVDVEGFEPPVLLGAEKTIPRFWPNLCIELTARWYTEDWGEIERAFAWKSSAPYRYFEITKEGPVAFDLDDFLANGARWTRQVNMLALRPDSPAFAALALKR